MSQINLNTEEVTRYSRQLLLPEFGIEGQQKLKRAKVLVVGVGGLGSPLTLYLAASGVGNIGILEFDRVDLSNLQRQIAYSTKDIGKEKAEVAGNFLKSVNPLVNITAHNTILNNENALEIFKDYDFIADCSDNFPTRYLINDACQILGKTYIYGTAAGQKGQLSVFSPDSACYRCLYPSPPKPDFSCTASAILGVIPGIIGTLMANQMIQLITGGKTLKNKLLLFGNSSFTELKIEKDLNCPKITELIDYDAFCGYPKRKSICSALSANLGNTV